MRTCDESPPGQLLLAIRQFNACEWFECHETLEELWIGEAGEVRNLYQGMLQVAVALHHWRNGNYGGAVSLLDGGGMLLGRVADACMWVNVSALIADAVRMRDALAELGKERMQQLDPAVVPKIRTVSTA